MPEQSAVPMIVLTRQQDHVEAINSNLRNAGIAARCHWLQELKDLAEALAEIRPHLLIVFASNDAADTGKVMAVYKQLRAQLPVLIAREQVDEDIIANAMAQGARDVVTLKHPLRLRSVVTRELEAFRRARALDSTLSSARAYREQLNSIMAQTADAFAFVQEGIVVEANPAWAELYGLTDQQQLIGTPLMDGFEPEAHAAIKGALVACLQGRWSNHPLRASAQLHDGNKVPLEMQLSRTEFEGEPAVRLSIAAKKLATQPHEQAEPAAQSRDLVTGALQRQCFIEELQRRLTQPIKAGVRQLLAIEPDKLSAVCEDIGALSVEDFVGQLAGLVRETLQATDLFGRFGDGTLVLLMERGSPRDIEAWANNLLRKVAGHVFRAGDKQVACSVSVGIGLIDPRTANAGLSLNDALAARREAQQAGGGRIVVIDHREEDTRLQAADETWARSIRAALLNSRFRLMQQPIASLLGEDRGMFDVLVRMVDDQGKEMLPAEFMAAAERNDLMKPIDRWVIGAALALCASRPVQQLFVRLSKDSVRDKSLLAWLAAQLKATRAAARHIAFQVSEQVASEYLADTTELAAGLRSAGFVFALDHFGAGRDSQRLLAQLPLQYIKIDGTLMQGLAVDPQLQQRVRDLVEQAKARDVATIAERVQDANTMAVLWQLGIEFIQGYFINEPEQVVMG